MENLTLIFLFFGGLGLFIYGMDRMADGLQKAAGNRMKSILGALTNNRLLGVATGALVTAIVQSSSATTVMIVGFVNAGIMNLMQAMGVIMGANIGTTITSWIVSSAEWLKFLKPSTLAPLAIGVGVFMMVFSKKKNTKQVGEIIAGFGILFLGLDLMKDAVNPFSDSPVFQDLFITLGRNPILGILAGAAVTAIIQSSSASVGILQTIAVMGLVPWNAAVYIILGQNIGTTVTAMISSVGANKTAKRAAYMHLLFNVVGSVFFAIVMVIFFRLNPTFGSGEVTMTGISIFHTIFNVTVTVLLFPFATLIVKLSGLFVKEEQKVEEDEEAIVLRHLDKRILETPGLALANAVKEIVRMGELAYKNLDACYSTLRNRDDDALQEIFETEKTINALERVITNYLVKINNSELNSHQVKSVTGLFHVINDIERIGDHAENLAELVREYHKSDLKFSDAAFDELDRMFDITKESLNASIEARREYDGKLVRKVKQNEEIIDDMEMELRQKHIYRLSQNICDSTSGVIFLDIISNLERVSDHSLNIVEGVEEEYEDLQ
ncbi:Na/Pi cotransporter family protein [Vallitalea okinawensis]|uniref:Na/Pi cotransporter family protein n=1 Tax=Vallitalea okinawensis TaxID=2078660 RepID=UPI000CFB5E40|nr:Na/Pi cotransporter family protein [Vallitalea okinawensis]